MKTVLFDFFKGSYRILSQTPLRRVPGIWKISNFIFRKVWPGTNVITIQGNKMHVDINDPDEKMRKTWQAYCMDLVHEEYTTILFKQLVKRGDVVVDVGANIGYFTILAAKLVGESGKVFAFEPEPKNFSYLKKNIDLNQYENVFAYQKAVSNKNEIVDLYVCDYDSGHHTIKQGKGIEAYRKGKRGNTKKIEVETVSLDTFLRDKIDRLDIIKIDAEGAEPLILEGMKGLVLSNRNIKIFMEFFPLLIDSMGLNSQKLYTLIIDELGLNIYIIGHDYSMTQENSSIIKCKSYDHLMSFIQNKDDHLNLFLTKEIF